MTNGLVVMTPSSIAYSSGSGSINADGSVAFSGVPSIAMNGVFTSDYDNYMVSLRGTASGSAFMAVRLRSGGSDITTNYTTQSITANGTSVSSARGTTNTFIAESASYNAQRCGMTVYLFGPYLAQPTAGRAIGVADLSGASIYEHCGTHSLSTSYDSMSVWFDGLTGTGLLTVFGFNQ